MLMKVGYLHAGDGGQVPVQIVDRPGAVLLECHEPGAFLAHVTGRTYDGLSSGMYVRAVFVPGEGAFVQLFDPLGTASDVLQLPDDQARSLLSQIW